MENNDQPKRIMLSQPPFSSLVVGERMNYRCFDELERLLEENEEFRNIIAEGIQTGQVCGFPEELWAKITDLVYSDGSYDDFETTFLNGANIGNCSKHTMTLSFCFNGCEICGGELPLIAGTRNSADGRHTWLRDWSEVYDTTLMLIMKSRFTQKLGYVEQNHHYTSEYPNYEAAKDQATDPEKRAERRKRKGR